MPEILKDGGIYFDPEDPRSIAKAVEKILLDDNLRNRIAARAQELSTRYTWARCARKTWDYLYMIAKAKHRHDLDPNAAGVPAGPRIFHVSSASHQRRAM